MRTSILAFVVLTSLLRAVVADAPERSDQARIQGIWLAETESQNGKKRNVAYQYEFKGDKLTFKDETGKEMRYSFKLDITSKPKLLLIVPADSPTSSPPVSVAYELSRDSLTIVVAEAGSRPKEISDKYNQELITCKRKSP